jgi:hypothetical protein
MQNPYGNIVSERFELLMMMMICKIHIGKSFVIKPFNIFHRSKKGKFYDQADAKQIAIRGQLRGHNNTPFGRPTPGRPIGPQGVGHSQGTFFDYH